MAQSYPNLFQLGLRFNKISKWGVLMASLTSQVKNIRGRALRVKNLQRDMPNIVQIILIITILTSNSNKCYISSNK